MLDELAQRIRVIPKEGDSVFVTRDFSTKEVIEHEGFVLGSEKEYFWLFVPTRLEIYRGHPDRVFDYKGKKIFIVYDYCKSIDKAFDSNGELDTAVFWHASNSVDRDRMIKQLKMYKLIC